MNKIIKEQILQLKPSATLAINEESPSYDYALMGFDYNNLRFRYFHGFLETKDLIQRYITGRGLEFTNEKSLIISLSEISIYSGVDRNMDFAYMNPISSHLEIEMNNRQNKLNTDQGNAVWQFSADWMVRPTVRISTNFLVDEL